MTWMVSSWLVILSAILLVAVQETNGNLSNKGTIEPTGKKKLHIGALIPFMLTHDQFSFHAAMKTAVRLINADDNILKDYELTISYNDSTVRHEILMIKKYQWRRVREKSVAFFPRLHVVFIDLLHVFAFHC